MEQAIHIEGKLHTKSASILEQQNHVNDKTSIDRAFAMCQRLESIPLWSVSCKPHNILRAVWGFSHHSLWHLWGFQGFNGWTYLPKGTTGKWKSSELTQVSRSAWQLCHTYFVPSTHHLLFFFTSFIHFFPISSFDMYIFSIEIYIYIYLACIILGAGYTIINKISELQRG